MSCRPGADGAMLFAERMWVKVLACVGAGTMRRDCWAGRVSLRVVVKGRLGGAHHFGGLFGLVRSFEKIYCALSRVA